MNSSFMFEDLASFYESNEGVCTKLSILSAFALIPGQPGLLARPAHGEIGSCFLQEGFSLVQQGRVPGSEIPRGTAQPVHRVLSPLPGLPWRSSQYCLISGLGSFFWPLIFPSTKWAGHALRGHQLWAGSHAEPGVKELPAWVTPLVTPSGAHTVS